jgi:hypothetical protein
VGICRTVTPVIVFPLKLTETWTLPYGVFSGSPVMVAAAGLGVGPVAPFVVLGFEVGGVALAVVAGVPGERAKDVVTPECAEAEYSRRPNVAHMTTRIARKRVVPLHFPFIISVLP